MVNSRWTKKVWNTLKQIPLKHTCSNNGNKNIFLVSKSTCSVGEGMLAQLYFWTLIMKILIHWDQHIWPQQDHYTNSSSWSEGTWDMLTLSLQSLTDNKIVKATFKHPYSLSLWQESLLIYNYRNFLMAKTIIILFTIVIII